MEQQGALTLPPGLSAELDRIGLEFLAGFLEVERSRYPANTSALMELGHVYTRLGRHEEGLVVDREVVRRCPKDPTAHYNLACSLALLGQTAAALDGLDRAIELGYDDAHLMQSDEDLASLRGEHRFRELVKRLETAGRG